MSENSSFWKSAKRLSLKSVFGRKAGGDVLADNRSDLLSNTTLQTPKNFFRSALKLSQYWATKPGIVGWTFLSTIVGMSFLNTYIGLQFAALNTEVIDGFNKANALATSTGTSTPEWQAMFGHTMSALGMWAGVTVALIANAVYSSNFSSKMAAHWRINMTKDFLDRYQKNNTSHRLQHVYNSTDNPEQRIQEDIATFTSTATSIPLGILNASLAVGAYSGMLWNMSKSIPIPFTDMHTPGWMLGVTLAITAGMTAWTYKVTKPLVVLSRMNQKLEADLRDGMGDWRKNAEAVAFLDGAGAERTALNKKFNAVMDNTYALIKRNKAIGWVQTYYGQATDFVPFILLGPAVMTGTLTYGQMIQARIAMAQVNSGMSWPLNSMDFFARLKATTDRLATLSEAMDQSITDYEHSHPDEQDTDIAPAFVAPPATQASSLPPMNMA